MPSSTGPSEVVGAKTPEAGFDGSSVEVGAGEIDVGSPVVVSEEPGPELCAAHDATRKAALTRAEFKAVCLLIAQYRLCYSAVHGV